MKLKHLPVIIGSSLVVVGMTANIGQAVTLVNFSVNSSPSDPSAVGQCTLSACNFSSGNSTTAGVLSLVATNQTVVRYNDAPYALTGIDYLLQGSDVSNFTFDPTSSSNIFSKVQVLNSGKELSFTGANITPGSYYTITRSYSPQSTNSFNPSFTIPYTVTVPEPSGILGILAFGVISAGYLLKRQRQNNVHPYIGNV